MTNSKTFEELWEKSEALYKNDASSIAIIINKLVAKLKLYEMLDENKDIPNQNEAKQYLMGHILSTLTHLSKRDNINVFAALQDITNKLSVETMDDVFKTKN